MITDTTSEWNLYQRGKDYNQRLNLVANVDKTERFYSGDQWHGVVSNGLPTPCFNVHKRVINYQIATILSQPIKIQTSTEDIPDDSQDPRDQLTKQASEIVNNELDKLWERLKMDSHMRHALRDAALSGDMGAWNFFNEELSTARPIMGQAPQGDIDFELLDNVNVFFGNPNDYRVQTQPYIIIAFRALVRDLRAEAIKNGVSEADAQGITADNDYNEQSGDRAKIELEGADDETGKTTALVKLWKDPKTKTIMWNKSTKSVVIRKDVSMGTKLYPIPWASWDYRKNSYHGQPIGLELIPNQIFINKMFAMVMLNLMNVAFPKAVYNSSIIEKWTNQVGQAIPVASAEDINKVATYLQPGNMSNQVMQAIDAAINYTKDLVGASDVAMGNVKPDNYSAFIAQNKANMVPLDTVKDNTYQWVEDLGLIWLDIMAAKYGKREVLYKGQYIIFDFSVLNDIKLNLKVDVGPSSYWSEMAAAQTLDNLLKADKISFLQYLERMPDGYIPQKQDLINEIKELEAQKAQNPPPTDTPNISIAFKDLPIAGQIQLAAQMGLRLTPEDFEDMQLIQQIITEKKQEMDLEQQAQAEAAKQAEQGAPRGGQPVVNMGQ